MKESRQDSFDLGLGGAIGTKPTQLLNCLQRRCSGLEDQFGSLLLKCSLLSKRSLLKAEEKCLCNAVQLYKDIQD